LGRYGWRGAPSAVESSQSYGGTEKGSVLQPPLRARTAVHHLTFSPATALDKASSLAFVSEQVGSPGTRTILALVATELSGVLVAFGLAACYRTWWALLWLAPLVLQLLSAICAVRREPLISLSSSAAAGDPGA
jgi:hypothetical protein